MNIRKLTIGGIITCFCAAGGVVTYDEMNDVVIQELSFDSISEMRTERTGDLSWQDIKNGHPCFRRIDTSVAKSGDGSIVAEESSVFK